MTHVWLTVIARLPTRSIARTRKVLEEFGNPATGQIKRGLLATHRVHFASAIIVPGDTKTQARLVLELSGDGPFNELVQDLDRHAGAQIRQLFEGTLEYRPKERVSALLTRLHTPVGSSFLSATGLGKAPGLNFSGTPGATVEQIMAEREIAREAAQALRAVEPATALEMVNQVRLKLRGRADFRHWLEPDSISDWDNEERPVSFRTFFSMILSAIYYFFWPLLLAWFVSSVWYHKTAAVKSWIEIRIATDLPDEAQRLGQFFHSWKAYFVNLKAWLSEGSGCVYLQYKPCLSFIGSIPWPTIITSIVALIFIIAILALVTFLLLSRREFTDIPDDSDPDRDKIAAIMERENHCAQNHLAGVSIMKGGLLRRMGLNIAFWVVGQLARRSFRPGFLSQVGTIHFARWVLVPGTNRLVFLSNYGGSWESYLEDFVTKASAGLTGVWSNTLGFPRSRNLFFEGAVDADRFKRWARRQQRPTYFWFSAYPELRTENIRRNAKIREGLAIAMTEDQAEDWLMMFGSAPRPATSIEADDIPTLVFGGLKRFRYSKAIVVSFAANNCRAAEWLRAETSKLVFGNRVPDTKTCRTVAFTADGLKRLGLGSEELSSFPPVFQSGMTAEHRSRILGDVGRCHPDKWDWGGGDRSVDAILLVYTTEPQYLELAIQHDRERFAKFGVREISAIDMQDLPEPGKVLKEPFGFVDGISQPVIKGTSRDRLNVNPMHLVEPGEIVLGYPDNRKYIPPTPRIPALNDPGNVLHEMRPGGLTKQIQSFDMGGQMSRDFGRNGTYLVVRQLKQDVKGFEDFLASAAQQLQNKGEDAVPDDYLKEWVAAKMIGRWRNGSPLVVNPYRDLNDRHLPGAVIYEALPGAVAPPSPEDRELDADQADLENNFLYGTGDPQGLRCPYGAHIRRAFPRESQRPNSDEQINIVNRHRIMRVGRPFIKKETGEEGLMFMCLNADIERQFEFIQQTWLNSKTFHGLDYEVDPIMGDEAADPNEDRKFTIPTPQGPKVVTGLRNFVQMIGGGYFFMPSKRAIRFLGGSD